MRLDYAFRAGNDTGAVLVAKNGYVVAERYANDRSADDLVTSWSVAKSVASALLGAALDDGYLHDLDEQHVQEFLAADDAEAWSETDKANITLRHMLTLRTAMRTVDGGDLYDAADQLAMSLDRPLIGEPGERLYDYSNGDVMIAGEVLYGATGMSAQHFLDRRIGALIDFQGDWWEDESGNVMSYCCLDALPRKFLRFGLLFARGGEWKRFAGGLRSMGGREHGFGLGGRVRVLLVAYRGRQRHRRLRPAQPDRRRVSAGRLGGGAVQPLHAGRRRAPGAHRHELPRHQRAGGLRQRGVPSDGSTAPSNRPCAQGAVFALRPRRSRRSPRPFSSFPQVPISTNVPLELRQMSP